MGAKLLELVGLSRRTEGLYVQPSYAADTQVPLVHLLYSLHTLSALPYVSLSSLSSPLQVPLLLALGRRALKLPSRWLARGLGRECWSHSEMRFWQRYRGQQAVSVPLLLRPLRAPQTELRPSREAANARMLRFGGRSSHGYAVAVPPRRRRCAAARLSIAPSCDGATSTLRSCGSSKLAPTLGDCGFLPRLCRDLAHLGSGQPSPLTCLPEGIPPEPMPNVTLGGVFEDLTMGKLVAKRKLKRT